ncbi:MAG TPA: hypothetical protein PKY78_04300 [Candidatus Omnitrophota bacterium]|nr:hypothetical protein [Candidatus Omnitrophota bacterium]HPS20192.1 hypothetical protein [Candidatus Omnitrophota bacterium]
MKKVIAVCTIFMFLFSSYAMASTNKPLKNLGDGLDNVVYGHTEVPDSIDQTKTKGKPAYEKCTTATKDDVGRGAARVVGGVWRILTFWYPEDDATGATK